MGQTLISILYFKGRSVVMSHCYLTNLNTCINIYGRVPQSYNEYMVGRETQFAKTSEMGIELGYKGYNGTLLEFDVVLDTTKNLKAKQLRAHSHSSGAHRRSEIKTFTGFHFSRRHHVHK